MHVSIPAHCALDNFATWTHVKHGLEVAANYYFMDLIKNQRKIDKNFNKTVQGFLK